MATNNNPGVFGYIGVFSSGPRTVDEAYEKQLEAVKAGGVKFYWTGAGTTDMAREGTMNLHGLLEKARFQDLVQGDPGLALLVPVARFPGRFRVDSFPINWVNRQGESDGTKNLHAIDDRGVRRRAARAGAVRRELGRPRSRYAPAPARQRRRLLHAYARLRRHACRPADPRAGRGAGEGGNGAPARPLRAIREHRSERRRMRTRFSAMR